MSLKPYSVIIATGRKYGRFVISLCTLWTSAAPCCARKATRTRKAGVNLFTALEPSLGSNPILRMRQEAFGPNELEDCGGVYLPLYFYGTF
eukprot:6184777-Pleurochrysis_carterae.AAC.1